jgi:[pyruvate, water dikinase]-phosphate phosphotransferase / [pyruvate, water dikinase] kinase
MTQKRAAFFVSDRTGITAEMLGHSLLTQFSDEVRFTEITLPFVDSVEKAQDAVEQIDKRAVEDGVRPLVISTLAKTEIAAVVGRANALFLDCFEMFIGPLERELGVHASHVMGRSHAVSDLVNYYHRIEAVNYTMAHDDGLSKRDLAEADVILVGVSRSGKTPTSLYLAMQFGIRAANYPLTPEDFPTMKLPSELQQFRGRLYGLTIGAKRLQEIREERMKHISNDRRVGKNYATLANCEYEIHRAEALMEQEGIRYLDATSKSVEELATTIVHAARLQRRIY